MKSRVFTSFLAVLAFAAAPSLATAQSNTHPWPSSGSVGIGTTNPSQKLDVAGNININTNGTNALFSTYKGASTEGGNIFIGGGGNSSQYDGSHSYAGSYNTSFGIKALYSNTTGYLNSAQGYGVLYSNTTGWYNSAQGYEALYSNTTGNSNSALGFQAGYNSSVPLQTITNSTFLGYRSNSSVDGITNSTAIGNGAQVTQSNQVVLGNSSVTQTLLNGNVGIGTTNPTYLLSVNGIVEAKEVIVQTSWSDYVFSPGYRLAPLAEVEQQIKSEKHLPGIPSAQQVAAHGISIGDMQARLLAKIEELTLHQIEQEKRIQKLEEENQKLRGLQ
jgi:hypothetical protein